MSEPFFGTESSPAADPGPPAEEGGAEVQPEPEPEAAPEPEPEATPLPAENADPQQVAEEAAAAEPQTPTPPDPDWLVEVQNNVPGIVGHALEQLYRLVTGG